MARKTLCDFYLKNTKLILCFFQSAHTCQGRAGSWVYLLDSILGQKLYCCSTCKIAAARHVPPFPTCFTLLQLQWQIICCNFPIRQPNINWLNKLRQRGKWENAKCKWTRWVIAAACLQSYCYYYYLFLLLNLLLLVVALFWLLALLYLYYYNYIGVFQFIAHFAVNYKCVSGTHVSCISHNTISHSYDCPTLRVCVRNPQFE